MYLLDTHVWIWYLSAHDRLKSSTRARLQKHENALFLSPISVWEAMQLARKGEFRLKDTPTRWVTGMLEALDAKEAPVTHSIAMLSRTLALPHNDPADRFIVATAKHLGLTLVTSDRALIASRACEVLEA